MDRIEGSEEFSTTDEKIDAVRNLYELATNHNNPNRDQFKIDPALRGRISSKVMSYNMYDNEKY
jgi:hypothetical protein